jgi:hypothetical protein
MLNGPDNKRSIHTRSVCHIIEYDCYYVPMQSQSFSLSKHALQKWKANHETLTSRVESCAEILGLQAGVPCPMSHDSALGEPQNLPELDPEFPVGWDDGINIMWDCNLCIR